MVVEAQSALEEEKKSLEELRQEKEEFEGQDVNVCKIKKTQISRLVPKIKTAEGQVAAAERDMTAALNVASAKHESDSDKQAHKLFLARACSLCLCVFVSHSRTISIAFSLSLALALSLSYLSVSLSLPHIYICTFV